MIFAGMVPHYGLIIVAMQGPTFGDGPRGGWQLLAIISAPLVTGSLAWYLWHSRRGTAWLVASMSLFAFTLSRFQENPPDAQNLGALVCLLPACVAAGFVIERTRPSADAVESPATS